MNVYTHSSIAEKAEAIGRLPGLSGMAKSGDPQHEKPSVFESSVSGSQHRRTTFTAEHGTLRHIPSAARNETHRSKNGGGK